MTLLIDVAIRSTLVLAAGLAAHALARRRSAALRHWILAASMAGAAAMFPLTLVVPAWQIPSAIASSSSPPQAPGASSGDAIVMTADEVVRTPPAPVSPIVAVWLAGVGLSGALVLIGLARLAGITRRAERVRDERWTHTAAQLAAAAGLTRRITIRRTRQPEMLATWGLFRPCVLLPSHAREWSDERIRIVLGHELAHIGRRDWPIQIAAEALRVAYWFNPLVWLACARLRHDAEQACDDAVLGTGVAARDYATHLLQLAKICRRPAPAIAVRMLAPRPSTLERRIAAMLNADVDRRAPSPRAIILTALLLACLTLPAAAFRAGQTALPLKGTVYDASGAVLPEVRLTLEDARQVRVNATTDSSGHFEFPSVAPGTYVLEAALAGFRALRHGVDLRTARDWDRAVTLQVGDLREEITVSAPRGAGTSAAPAAPVRIGGNIRAPSKLVDVRPVYPAAMRDAGREGVVPLEAIIARDGTVTSLRVMSAQVHPDFAVAAMDAVRQWRFDPTLLNGEPVEVVMSVSVSFKLSD